VKKILFLLPAIIVLQRCLAGVQTNNVEPIPASDFFKSIHWDQLKKSEFESQAEYAARIEKGFEFAGKPIWLEASDSEISFSYDAEDKKATIGLLPESGGPSSNGLFCLSSTNWSIGHREEQNAFGAKVDVAYFEGEKYEIKILNLNDLPQEVRPDTIRLGFVFKFDPARAEFASKNKTLRFLLRVVVDHIRDADKSTSATTPTLGMPDCFMVHTYELPVRLIALKVIDKKSATTLASWSQN